MAWQTKQEIRPAALPGLCPHTPPHLAGDCPDVMVFDFRPPPRRWRRRGVRLFGRFVPLGRWRSP